MNKRGEIHNNKAMKTGRIDDAMQRYGVGRQTIRKVAKEAKAEIKIGRSYLVNFEKLDAYFDAVSR